jgi:uncharacterized membrane protein
VWALLAALLASACVLVAWRQRGHARQEGQPDLALLLAAAAAALLLLVAGFDLVPLRLLPSAWLVVAMAVALSGRRLADWGVSLLAVVVAGLGLIAAVQLAPELWRTVSMSLAGIPALVTRLPPSAMAFWALLLPSLLLFPIALLLPRWMPRERVVTAAAAGALFAAAAYVAFKQVFALGSAEDMVARGLAERLVLTQALFAGGWLLSSGRVSVLHLDRTRLAAAGRVLTAIAAARFIWFDLLIHNPVLDTMNVGRLPLLNLIVPAFLGSALWFYLARRRGGGAAVKALWLALFLAALIGGTLLLVRQGFQGAILTAPGAGRGELYSYSLVALLLSVALLLAGTRLADKALRVAGLGMLTATILKVFLVDAGALEGVLRILSFLVLGIALIGVGKLYGTVLKEPVKA